MTPQQYRALGILTLANSLLTEQFARRMWPNSRSWSSPKYPGRGAMYAARVLLRRLAKRGWVNTTAQPDGGRVYNLTLKGRADIKTENARRARTKKCPRCKRRGK